MSVRRVVVAWFAVCAAVAQGPPAFRSEVELVAIPCTVVDARGTRVDDLQREEFRVFDNDVPRNVEFLWHDEDQPLTLGVLIDVSDSQRDIADEHRATAEALLNSLLRPGDGSFVMAFGGADGSPIWNAVYDAARERLRPVKGNKALLLLTDGYDTGSAHTWRQAADEAQKSDAAVYAIQYRSSSGRSYAPDLNRLVTETGGAGFSAPGDLRDVVTRLEIDLRRRYVLGFRPERLNLAKVRHEVRVEVTRPELTVRAKKSYWETPRK